MLKMLFAACFDLDCFRASNFPLIFFLAYLYMHVKQNVNELEDYVSFAFLEMMLLLTYF